jgi:methylated-DNA-[protein]-cysteine S-methyltransferase
MRTNPFAPDVPCHRVLATDRTIGGYKGAWGNGGTYAEEKTKLLRSEGVVFDEKGRAGGEVFKDFADLGMLKLGKEL